MDALVKTSEGDLRKAITFLQTSARLVRPRKTEDGDIEMTTSSNEVTAASIQEIAGVIPDKVIENLLQACQPGKIGLYSRIAPVVEGAIAEGWSAGGIIMQVCFYPVNYLHLVT